MFDKDTGNCFNILSKGSYFGEMEVLLDLHSNYTYLTPKKEFVEFYCIKANYLTKLLALHEKER